MNYLRLNFVLLALFAMTAVVSFQSCEKATVGDEASAQKQEGNDDSPASDNDDVFGEITNHDASKGNDTLSVAEFIEGNFDGGVFVEGYVIGDCTKSFKYAEFERPFTHEQALLIADNMDERSKGNIVAVQLKNGTNARNHMNLVDNPGWHGRKVVLFGYWGKYLGMTGLKDLGSYPLYDP